MELPSALFKPNLKKKKISVLKKCLILSQKKLFLYFKNLLYQKFLYFLIFQKMELSSSNIKTFLIFFLYLRKWNLQ